MRGPSSFRQELGGRAGGHSNGEQPETENISTHALKLVMVADRFKPIYLLERGTRNNERNWGGGIRVTLDT